MPHPTDPASLVAARTRQFGETVFATFSALALEHDAVNLGQGFPDFDPPAFVREAGAAAILGGDQQYAPSPGLPALCEAVARDMAPSLGREPDPHREVTVTVGATEGLFASFHALVDPGDEVVLIEPFYDAYPADLGLCGGVARYVPLLPDGRGGWELDLDDLGAAFGPRTKLVVLNTPHNPTGHVFSDGELRAVAALCQEHDALALCDEVYDRMVFDGREHRRLAALPGMWERTVTLGSAGKTFSVTGWKIGWAVAPPALTLAIRRMHQWMPFAVARPLQRAVAAMLEQAPGLGYFGELRAMYQRKRDLLVGGLRAAGLMPMVPGGTYFVMADTTALGFDGDDVALCRHLIEHRRVAAIPPSPFYSPEHRHLARRLIRLCFCKEDDTLSEAIRRLKG